MLPVLETGVKTIDNLSVKYADTVWRFHNSVHNSACYPTTFVVFV